AAVALMTPGPLAIGSIRLATNTQFLAVAISIIGVSAVYLGVLAKVINDLSGLSLPRWTSRFPYNRTLVISAIVTLTGVVSEAVRRRLEAEAHRVTRVAIVGLGLIGRERLLALEALRRQGRPVTVAGVLDPDRARIAAAREICGAQAAAHLDGLVELRPDWFVVATPHDDAVQIVPRLLTTGARVLVEK